MDEDIDVGIETSVDTSAADSVNVEPLADIPVEEIPVDSMDGLNETEPPISEQEFSELVEEAEALEIQPFEESEPLAEPLDPNQEISIDYEAIFEGLDEYNFDGKDYNQNSEQLNSLLEGFKEDNWNNMELEGQKEKITGLFDYVNNVIGLKNTPNIEYYNKPEQGDYGGYDPAANTLSINEHMFYDPSEVADTVAHELWHAYQHERAANPQAPKDFQYQIGFDNYIRPGDDFDWYKRQLVEAEARAFADQFKGALAQMGRV